MENCGDFPVFLQAFINNLWLKEKKDRMDIFVAELLNCTKDWMNFKDGSQYTSEADLSESLWLDCGSCLCAFPMPYIMYSRHLNSYIWSCYHTP